jgi:hypothetical protein
VTIERPLRELHGPEADYLFDVARRYGGSDPAIAALGRRMRETRSALTAERAVLGCSLGEARAIDPTSSNTIDARHARRGGRRGRAAHGPDGGLTTGSDFLMDGGVTAAYWYGEIPEVRN